MKLSRRDFFFEGLGLAGVIAAGKAPATIIRSSIGGRFICENCDDSISAADYIRNGMVALWDGIENAGFGVHDESSTTWADLSGNGCDLIAPIQYDFGPYYCDIAKGNYFIGELPLVLTASTTEFVGCFTEPYTSTTSMDLGVDIGGRGIGCAYLSAIANSSNDFIASHRYSITGGRTYYIRYAPYPSNAREAYVNVLNTFSATDKMSSSISDCKIYVNGQKRDGSQSVYWSTGASAATTSVYVGSEGGKTDIRLCCVRMYSRALTADEISYNYAIDKVRFGI